MRLLPVEARLTAGSGADYNHGHVEHRVTERYNRGAIALHWITAILIVANLILGLSMVQLPISPRKLHWYLWHKGIGITIFLVTSVRLAWRALHPHPAQVPMPSWQRRAATASHALMYALLLITPVSGWLYSSATGVQVVYLGVVALPNLVPKDKALADALLIVHITLNSLLFAMVCIHIAAALKHHFIDHDAALARMLPNVKPKET
jgi:cytochrome b561